MKPKCSLIGENGNVFNIIGRVQSTLIKAGQSKEAKEFVKQAFTSSSYDAVLRLCEEYVVIT